MGDAHEGIVNGVDQGVEGLAVSADDHEVGYRTGLEGDITAHQIVEGDVLIGHAQAQHGGTALGAVGGLLLFGQVAVEVVVAQLGVFTLSLVTLFDLFGG